MINVLSISDQNFFMFTDLVMALYTCGTRAKTSAAAYSIISRVRGRLAQYRWSLRYTFFSWSFMGFTGASYISHRAFNDTFFTLYTGFPNSWSCKTACAACKNHTYIYIAGGLNFLLLIHMFQLLLNFTFTLLLMIVTRRRAIPCQLNNSFAGKKISRPSPILIKFT